jgi:hypothetical protein
MLSTAVAVLAIGMAVTSASGDSSKRSKRKHHVIHVQRVVGQDVYLDLDHSGSGTDSIGDEDVFWGEFFIGDRKVGSDGGVCKLVRLPLTYHCVATNVFRKGSITVQFLADFTSTEPGHFAITGGTGAYRGASGEVLYVGKPDGGADVTMRFTTRR